MTLRNGADLIYEDNVGQPWMLIVENTAGKLEINAWKNYEVTTDRRMWKGPVTLEKPLTVSMGGSAVTNSVGFAGKVSGTGGFNGQVEKTGRKYWFMLTNPDNDFTGGVALTNFTLGVGAATAIPSGAGAGPLELVDSTVGLYGGLPSFAFPDTTFIGTGAIVGSSSLSVGTVRSLTKKGAGTLSVGAHLTAGEVAQLVKTQTGYVVARDWSGTVPKTADLTRSAGWVLRERDGDLKVVRESGVFIIFR